MAFYQNMKDIDFDSGGPLSDDPEDVYADAKHPQVEATATKALRLALAEAKEHAFSTADLWDVFIEFLRRYQYGQFMDGLTSDIKDDLKNSIAEEYYIELRAEALANLKKDLKEEYEEKIYSEIYDEMEARLQKEIEEKLRLEIEEDLRGKIRAQLMSELKPQVENALKVELMGNPDFVDEAKREIKRKILGL